MPEELNQVTTDSTETTTDDLSIDEVAEDTTEDTEQEETEQTEQAETEEPQVQGEQETASPYLQVKYNGAEQELTKEQAIEFAQKGMNYDKVLSKLEAVTNSPALKTIQQQAQAAGLTIEQYAEKLSQFQEQAQMNRIAKEIKRQHPDADDTLVNELATRLYAENQQAVRSKQQQAQMNLEAQRKQQMVDYVEAFEKEYPNVDKYNLPAEVVQDIKNGETPLAAYRAYENRQLKAALEAEKKNATNKKKAVGSLSTEGEDSSSDPFVKGLGF